MEASEFASAQLADAPWPSEHRSQILRASERIRGSAELALKAIRGLDDIPNEWRAERRIYEQAGEFLTEAQMESNRGWQTINEVASDLNPDPPQPLQHVQRGGTRRRRTASPARGSNKRTQSRSENKI